MAPRISVVVNTLNEEANLPFALRSVARWADEIVVVDMHSDDRTRDIAREFGAVVHLHERSEIVDAARAFALEQAGGDWILLLDADEIIPAPLARKLHEIARADEVDAVTMSRINYILGIALPHTGWGPRQDLHTRFFRRGAMYATDTIHGFLHPVPNLRVATLPYAPDLAIVHFAYFDLTQFIEKLNRYTGVEARQAFERGERASRRGAVLRAAREFLGRYLKNSGYRDGWRGFYLSFFMAFYRLAADAKLAEIEAGISARNVRREYHRRAEALLDDEVRNERSELNERGVVRAAN